MTFILLLSTIFCIVKSQTLQDTPFTLKFTGSCRPQGSPPTYTICHLNATSQTRDSVIQNVTIKDDIYAFGTDVITVDFNATFLTNNTLWDVGYFTVNNFDKIFFQSLQPSTNVNIPGLLPGQQGTGMWNFTSGNGKFEGVTGTCTVVGVGQPFNNNDNVYLYITSILWMYV
eukprot:502184_1